MINRAVAVILTLCILGLVVPVALATTIRVDPADITVASGENFTVEVYVDPEGSAIVGVDYVLRFNTSLLNATKVTRGTFFGGFTTFQVVEINNTRGTVDYGETILGAGNVTASGTIATISFQAFGTPGTSDLEFQTFTISDPDARPLPANATNGSVTIILPPAPFLIYGWVYYEDGSVCDNPQVNITNLNTSGTWQAETNPSDNYYQLILASGTDVNAPEQLQFRASRAGSEQTRLVVYPVSSHDVAHGGLLPYNISLTEPGRQTWYFTTENASPPLSSFASFNKTMTKSTEGGDEIVTLAPGECVWFYADQLANYTVPFPGGTWDVSYWVKALHETESNTVLDTRLQSLTPEGGNTTITENASSISYSEGALQEIKLALATESFSVLAGGRFAVALCWPANATGSLEIHCNPPERHASFVTSPYSDPGYPVPELPSVLLLGLGLLVLLGLYGLRGKRRLG